MTATILRWLATALLVGMQPLRLAAAPAGAETAPAQPTTRLLVIAPERFHSALEDFVSFKRTLLPTRLISLEKVLTHNPGVDAPEKLKRYLFDQWRHHHLGYVLLVGDVDVLPVRFMVLDRVTPAAFDYAFYPSDLYYSDLAKADGSFDDWNAQKESFHAGYFGEVRGEKNKSDPINFDQVDYRPDIAVGRWPVDSPEQVRLVAAKTIAYEKQVLAGRSPRCRRAALLAVGGWVDSRPLLDQLAGELASGWHIEKRFYKDGAHDAATPPPTHEQVRELFQQGLGLVVHTGHGEADGWAQCFSLRDLAWLTNQVLTPVVISAGCSTAYFAPLPPYDAYVDVNGQEHAGTDHHEVFSQPPPPPAPYQRGRFNPSGLGERMLKHSPGGAVAYIGCDTGSQPCALTLVAGFIQALATAKQPRLGDCWAEAIRFYYDREHLAELKPTADWYPPSIFFQGMKFVLFGDPSLRLPQNSSPS
jgi:Peptidase family C25